MILQGCASGQPPKDPSPVLTAQPRADRLAEASLIAAQALERLSRIESTRTPIAGPSHSGLVPDLLVKPVTIDWTGPVEGIAKRLSGLARYDFAVLGKPPAADIIVRLSSQDTTLIEAFKDIGFQSGPRALVRVNARKQKVELVYDNS